MKNSVNVQITANYIAEQSRPELDQYVFAYTVKITNQGDNTVQLISRKWLITDAENQIQEVEGIGVVGEQPYISSGQSYTYTSGAVIGTPAGTMSGSFKMKDEKGAHFEADIPVFALVQKKALH